jgi:biotin carboxyl carrier protein
LRYRVRLSILEAVKGGADPSGGAGGPAEGSEATGPEMVVELPALRPGQTATATVDGRPVELRLEPEVDGEEPLTIDGRRYLLRELPPAGEETPGVVQVRFLERGWLVTAEVASEVDRLRSGPASPAASGPFTVESPLPGVVQRVLSKPGDEVRADTPLLTLEAMKMENEVRPGRAGRVAEIFVVPGQVVNGGDRLALIQPL